MIERLNVKKKQEWENIKDEDEKNIRKEKQEMKENLWKWRSSQKSLLKDPRERMSTEKKIAILEELLEKEKKERKERKEEEEEEEIEGGNRFFQLATIWPEKLSIGSAFNHEGSSF